MDTEPETSRWKRPPLPALIAVALVVALVFWSAGDDALESSDLDLIPRDASFLFVVDVDAVNSSALGELIRSAFEEKIRKAEAEIREAAGFGSEDLSQFAIGGNAQSGDAVFIFVFKDEPDEERIAKLAGSLRMKSVEPTEVGGYRVWGSETDRMGLVEIRGGTLFIGRRSDIEHALEVLDSGATNKLADLLADQGVLDSPIAAAFDWSAVGDLRRGLARKMPELVPALAEHVGPVVLRADVDDGLKVEWLLLDAEHEVAVRSTIEVDGGFIEKLVDEIARFANRPPPAPR